VLYLHTKHLTLALKLFRGEQAISWFVWHITPNHSSSETLQRSGFGPPRDITRFNLTMVSSLGFVSNPCNSLRPIQTRFRYGSACTPLTLPQKVTRWLILQKARRHPFPHKGHRAPTVVSTRFQVLFHSPHRGSFHLSLTVLVHYRSPRVFSLGRWTPQIPTD
jgi:hypothetical protein